MTNRELLVLIACIVLALGFATPACSNALENRRADGLDPATLPVDIRADYLLFAGRCSKCHSLSRPLQSGITADSYWSEYVERMRRQPGSGIAPNEVPHILNFLRYYSASVRAERVESPPEPAQDGGDAW